MDHSISLDSHLTPIFSIWGVGSNPFQRRPSGYVKIAIENGDIYSDISHWTWCFSIVMLVYQRVPKPLFRVFWPGTLAAGSSAADGAGSWRSAAERKVSGDALRGVHEEMEAEWLAGRHSEWWWTVTYTASVNPRLINHGPWFIH